MENNMKQAMIRYIEENFGMSYRDWNLLDISEQEKLLKVRYDNRDFIDGIPVSNILDELKLKL